MISARVIGELWATRKSPRLEGRSLKLCVVRAAASSAKASSRAGAANAGGDGGGDSGDTDRVIVAIDTLDARRGDQVLIAFGSGARNVLRAGPDNRDILCDAAVSMIIDGSSDPRRAD